MNYAISKLTELKYDLEGNSKSDINHRNIIDIISKSVSYYDSVYFFIIQTSEFNGNSSHRKSGFY